VNRSSECEVEGDYMANFPQPGMCCHDIKFDIDIVRDNSKVLNGRNRNRSTKIIPKREWSQLYQERLGAGRDRCCNSRKRFVYFKLLGR